MKAAQRDNLRRDKEIEMMEKQIEILEVLKAKIDAMTDGKEAAEAYRKLFNMNNSETDLGVNLDVNTNNS